MSETDNKRTDPRFGPLVIKARVDEGERHRDGYLTNVSTGGAFLAIDEPPDVGSEVDLRALMPWKLGELRARARVVWRNEERREEGEGQPRIPGAGVAFVELTPASKKLLGDYLARFAELAARIE